MIKVLETFSGVGAQRMALKKANIPHEVIGISEIDQFSIKSYEAIHGSVFNYGDISKINVESLPDFDLLTYSFPCTDISQAGKMNGLKKGSGTSSSLLWETQRIIEHKLPKYLLMENVKNLVNKRFIDDFKEWVKYLEELGYQSEWKVINAQDHGVPQNRERVFMVSMLTDTFDFSFPEKKPLNKNLSNIIEKDADEKYFFKQDKQSEFVPSEKSREVSFHKKLILSGKIEHKGWFDQMKRVYDVNGASPTLTTMQGGNRQPKIIDPNYNGDGIGLRKLTPLECWRLMGFSDDDFNKSKQSGMSDSQLYKQAGNSIVVDVLVDIFKNMFL